MHRPSTHKISDTARTGAMFGLAIGDAWGDPVEFLSYPEIVERHGRRGPAFPTAPRVTDDTQMSLAVWDAITDSVRPSGAYHSEQVGGDLAWRYRAWSQDPDNNRAPGTTCMAACALLANLSRWRQAGRPSLGCGTVMRAPWIGLHPHVLPAGIGAVAELSAIVTHTLPEAVMAAHAAAVLTYALAVGAAHPGSAAGWLRTYAELVGPLVSAARDLAQHPVVEQDPEQYIAEGWAAITEAATAASDLADDLAQHPWDADPCELLPLGPGPGRHREGWDAVSCLALAVGILDGMDWHTHAGDRHRGHDTIRRAVCTGGDSDSVAAVTGALAGAAYGSSVLGDVDLATLEARYRDAIDARLHAAYFGTPAPAAVFGGAR